MREENFCKLSPPTPSIQVQNHYRGGSVTSSYTPPDMGAYMNSGGAGTLGEPSTWFTNDDGSTNFEGAENLTFKSGKSNLSGMYFWTGNGSSKTFSVAMKLQTGNGMTGSGEDAYASINANQGGLNNKVSTYINTPSYYRQLWYLRTKYLVLHNPKWTALSYPKGLQGLRIYKPHPESVMEMVLCFLSTS